MKLNVLMSIIDCYETVHIIDDVTEETVFFGKLWNAYSELDEAVIKSRNVLRMFSGFGGLCIETVVDK